ncbi:MAG: sugar phosphate nucleotidyltransferase [Candidatus Doudnabacteria bacterium]|jgi:NDP-sugar pyrophosphorylase family protein
MNRERLTITLRSDLLNALDGTIDGERLRNRSHAIEYYLSKSLGEKEVPALILAGGKPVYFDSEKKSLPKAMVKIAGKPLLEQTLLRLKKSKFNEVVISVGEGGEIIKDYFKDGKQFGLKIKYSQQPVGCKGTAQAVLAAKLALGSGQFVLIYGDVLSDLDFGEFLEFHRQQKKSVCTMSLTGSESVDMWGLAKLNGNKIVSFEEKPKNPKTFSRLVNAGIYVMEPEIFKYLQNGITKLESGVFPRLAEEGKLSGYPFEGLWLDISSSAAYSQASKQFKGI